ncbi:unnamed protein product, partial [Brachionus calyciflorus]
MRSAKLNRLLKNEREELTILRADQSQLKFRLSKKDDLIQQLKEQFNAKKSVQFAEPSLKSLYFNKKDNESSQSDDESDNEEDYNLNKEKLETNINNYKLTNITDQSFFLDNSVLNESKLPLINKTETIKTDPSTSNYYRVEPSAPYKTSSSEYVPTPININPIGTQTNELLINNSDLRYSNKTITKERETDHLNNGKYDKNTPKLSDYTKIKPDSPLELVKFVAELASKGKTRRLDPNTKKFSGSSSEDVDDWLFNIDQAFISANIREEDSTWTLFEKELRNTFTKINKEYWVREQLATLKHRENMPFENFVNKFYMLTNMTPFVAEEEKLFHFREGLREQTKKEVTCRNNHTLSETIHLATQLEQNQTNLPSINYQGHTRHSKGKFTERSLNNRNHIYKNKQYQKKEKDFRDKSQKRKNNYENPKFVKNGKQNPNQNEAFCKRCKRKGHYENTCYANLRKINSCKLNENLESKVYVVYLDEVGPKIKCSIKGLVDNKTLKIGLDCGATNSIMNHMTAINNKIEILRSNLKIRTANGKVSHISGVTKPKEHKVYGTGFHCLKKRHIPKTSMSFFGEKYESLRTENVKLSRDECF